MLIGIKFVSLNDTSNESLGHLHNVLFISCVFLPKSNTVLGASGGPLEASGGPLKASGASPGDTHWVLHWFYNIH